jgi:hypothetical protein
MIVAAAAAAVHGDASLPATTEGDPVRTRNKLSGIEEGSRTEDLRTQVGEVHRGYNEARTQNILE